MIKDIVVPKITNSTKVITDCKSSYESVSKENNWNLKQIKSGTYVDEENNIKKILKEDMKLGYRTSIFKEKPWIILNAVLKLKKGNKEECLFLVQDR